MCVGIGLPKGTMLTHYNLTANLLQSLPLVAQDDRTAGGCVISPLPMFHIYALMVRAVDISSSNPFSLIYSQQP